MTPDFLVLGVIWYIVFLFSTTCHEGAHALAAKIGGDTTAFEGGQVSLNPIPHIRRSPVGLVVVPIISYFVAHWMIGWASAPYDPQWQERHPHRAAWMALAGPAANFTLVILSAIAIHAGILAGVFERPASAGFTSVVIATVPGIARFRGHISQHRLRSQSASRHLQSSSRAAAGWQHGHHARSCLKIPLAGSSIGFAPRASECSGSFSPGICSTGSLAWSSDLL